MGIIFIGSTFSEQTLKRSLFLFGILGFFSKRYMFKIPLCCLYSFKCPGFLQTAKSAMALKEFCIMTFSLKNKECTLKFDRFYVNILFCMFSVWLVLVNKYSFSLRHWSVFLSTYLKYYIFSVTIVLIPDLIIFSFFFLSWFSIHFYNKILYNSFTLYIYPYF